MHNQSKALTQVLRALTCLFVYLGAFVLVQTETLLTPHPRTHGHCVFLQSHADGFDLVFRHQHETVAAKHHHHHDHRFHFVSHQQEMTQQTSKFTLPDPVISSLLNVHPSQPAHLAFGPITNGFPLWPKPPPPRQSHLVLKTVVLLI